MDHYRTWRRPKTLHYMIWVPVMGTVIYGMRLQLVGVHVKLPHVYIITLSIWANKKVRKTLFSILIIVVPKIRIGTWYQYYGITYKSSIFRQSPISTLKRDTPKMKMMVSTQHISIYTPPQWAATARNARKTSLQCERNVCGRFLRFQIIVKWA